MQSFQYGRTPGQPAIAYARCGQEGPTVFFLHGVGGNKSNWSDQLAYFGGQGHSAVAWDVRGYGDSDDYEGSFDFAHVSQDLIALMDHLQVQRAHFVGLSMGGRILMDFAHRHPERLESLVICGAFPSFNKALGAEQREQYLRLRQEPLLAGRTFEELAPSLIHSLAGPNISADAYERLHESICRLRKDSYLKALAAAAHFDRSQEIRSIKARTLLVYAQNDLLTPPAMGAEVAAMLPHAEFVVLPDCGHLMNLESSEAFNQTVYGFISNVAVQEQ